MNYSIEKSENSIKRKAFTYTAIIVALFVAGLFASGSGDVVSDITATVKSWIGNDSDGIENTATLDERKKA